MSARDAVDLSPPFDTDAAPAAEAPAAGSTALVVLKQAAISELVTLADGLADLQTKYSNVAYAVATSKGMEEAKAARAAIREPRYKVPHIVKAKKAELKQVGEDIEAFGDKFIADCLLLETPIHEQIKVQEDIEATEAKERKRIADETNARVQKAIDDMRDSLSAAAGKKASEIADMIVAVECIVINTEIFGKRAGEAKQIQTQTGEALAVLHDAAVATETQLAELARLQADAAERDRVENERKEREAKAETDRIAKEAKDAANLVEAQRIANQAEADRVAAEQAKTKKAMEEITRVQGMVGTATREGSVEGTEALMESVNAWTPDEAGYGFLLQPALLAKGTTLAQLKSLLAKLWQDEIDAVARVEEEARAAAARKKAEGEAAAAAQKKIDDELAAHAERDAVAARERLKQKLALAKAQNHAEQLVTALKGMDTALEALTDGDTELACIPEGTERDELVSAWDIGRAALRAVA